MRVAEYVRRAQGGGGAEATAVLARVVGWMVFAVASAAILFEAVQIGRMGFWILGPVDLVPAAVCVLFGVVLVGSLWMGVHLWSLTVMALVKYLGAP